MIGNNMNFQLYQRHESSGSFTVPGDCTNSISSSDFDDDDSFCKDSVAGRGLTRRAAINRITKESDPAANDDESDLESFCKDSVVARRRAPQPPRAVASITTDDESDSNDFDDDDSFCRDSVKLLARRSEEKAPVVKAPTKKLAHPKPILKQTAPIIRRAPPPTLLQLSKSLNVSSLSLNGSSAHGTRAHDDYVNCSNANEEDESEMTDDFFDDDCLCIANKDNYGGAQALDLSYIQHKTHIGSRAA